MLQFDSVVLPGNVLQSRSAVFWRKVLQACVPKWLLQWWRMLWSERYLLFRALLRHPGPVLLCAWGGLLREFSITFLLSAGTASLRQLHVSGLIRILGLRCGNPEWSEGPRPLRLLGGMVGAAGIEPATLGLEIRCSIRLSYAPPLLILLAREFSDQYFEPDHSEKCSGGQ